MKWIKIWNLSNMVEVEVGLKYKKTVRRENGKRENGKRGSIKKIKINTHKRDHTRNDNRNDHRKNDKICQICSILLHKTIRIILKYLKIFLMDYPGNILDRI